MIKAIIIDDELHCRKTLSILLKEYCPEVQVVDQCSSAQDGIIAIGKSQPDVVFLDIEMPGMNGFDMLEKMSEITFAVIFTTGYDQYAIKAFRFYAIDYLLKPIEPKELISAVHKVQVSKKVPATDDFQLLLNKINKREEILAKIPVPTSDGFELIAVDDVLYCEARDNYTFIYLRNKKKIVACRMLKEVEEQLTNFPHFVRTHNSYIVNIKEVKKYVRGEGGYVILSDDTSVNVSRSRKEDLLKRFGTSTSK
jgi:two-component system, LytTR family, response regulator